MAAPQRPAHQIAGGIILIAVRIALLTGAWPIFVGLIRDQLVTTTVLPI